MELQAAELMRGDITPFGVVSTVVSLRRPNLQTKVNFEDGTSKIFTIFQKVTVLSEQ